MKAFARYWQGTDALTLVMMPPGKFVWRFRIWGRRLFWRLLWERFGHIVCAENEDAPIVKNLEKFGISRKKMILLTPPVKHPKRFRKKKHEGINILFYWTPGDGSNIKFKKWIYGYDILEELKKEYPTINFIVVNGGQNMSEIFPITDMYIRPTRHDGFPRLIQECRINKIPYFWSNDMNVCANEVSEFINENLKELSK